MVRPLKLSLFRALTGRGNYMSERIQSLTEWFKKLTFTEPAYFKLFDLVWLMVLVLGALLLLKLLYRPKKSKYSQYKLFGKDLVWLMVVFICVLAVLALAGPRVSSGYTLSQSGSVDVLVLMDNSFSMRADDIKPSRQEAAKKMSLSLVEKGILKPGDRVTLFVFGGIARWRMPFSEDFKDFQSKVAEISHTDIYQEESQLDTDYAYLLEYVPKCLDEQDNFFKNNSSRFSLNQHNNNRVAFLLSDGADEGGRKLDIGLKEFNRKNIKTYTVAIGTASGTEVKIKAYNPKDPKQPPVGITIKTKIQTKELERIAGATRGDSFVFDSESEAGRLEAFMRNAVNSNRSSLPRLVYSDKGRDIWWEVLAMPAVTFLLLIVWIGL